MGQSVKMDPRPSPVIPANAGIHAPLDPRTRANDNESQQNRNCLSIPQPGDVI
jgi:hypothetical protein